PAEDAISGAVARAIERGRTEARRVAAAVTHLLEWRQDGADIEERPRRSPVDEIIAQRERADRRAGDAVAALAELRIGDAGQQRQVRGDLFAAMDSGGERASRAEGADAIAAIDLLVDAEQHRAEHAVGDHLVEALVGEAADRSAAGIGAGYRGRSHRILQRWRSVTLFNTFGLRQCG